MFSKTIPAAIRLAQAGDTIHLRLEIPDMQAADGMLPHLHLNGTLVHKQEHMLGIRYEPASKQPGK